MEETRARIAAAAMRLHTTVGPSKASIAAVAEEAGVTRLTVYRHFADQDEIFTACMAHWAALHPRPDPSTWIAIPDLETRARRALTELYGWYGEVAQDLAPIHRDLAYVPAGARESILAGPLAMAAIIAGPDLAVARAGRRVRAAAVLAVTLGTYRLLFEQGLSAEDAVDLGVHLIRGASEV